MVLPTGLGKTLIALMLIKDSRHALFLTPTKPLAQQHAQTVKEVLGVEAQVVSGEVKPEKREKLYEARVVVATPQTVLKDIERGYKMDFDLVIFDECHHAVGNYAYTKLAQHFEGALFLGLTASPGGDRERIEEVMEALKMKHAEIRSAEDEDVKPFVKKKKIEWRMVELTPKLKEIKERLKQMVEEHARLLEKWGFKVPLKKKGEFLAFRKEIEGTDHPIKFKALMEYGILTHLLHMQELIETQGPYALKEYISKLKSKETKGAKEIVKDPTFARVEMLLATCEDHPKIKALLEELKGFEGKVMVFVQYRSQLEHIVEILNKNGIRAAMFVGKRKGFTKKQQEEIIEKFRRGEIDVLVASSVGEEGLDIPSVDMVIFYEPVPSEIRSIQRRGRAGRWREGRVVVLITRGTRDQAYYYAAKKKEQKMKSIIKGMQRPKQRTINEFF